VPAVQEPATPSDTLHASAPQLPGEDLISPICSQQDPVRSTAHQQAASSGVKELDTDALWDSLMHSVSLPAPEVSISPRGLHNDWSEGVDLPPHSPAKPLPPRNADSGLDRQTERRLVAHAARQWEALLVILTARQVGVECDATSGKVPCVECQS
jgi:hypothetical protein